MPVDEDLPVPDVPIGASTVDRAVAALLAHEAPARMTADYAEAVARVVQRLLDGDIAYRPGTDPFGDLLRRAHDQGLPQIDEGSVARKERLLEFLRHREDDGTNGETGEPVPDIVIGQ